MITYFKSTFLVFFLFHCACFAQDQPKELEFKTKYYDAVDQWVVFPSGNDGSYPFGFIYIDRTAGFTFDLKNSLTIEGDTFIQTKKDSTVLGFMKYRLEPNTKLVYVLSDDQIKQLNLEKTPDWLDIYKSGSETTAYLQQIGYFYNHVGASHNALKPLLEAYEKDPNHPGLVFELGFAYNATGEFEKAIPVLETEINTTKDQLLYKELGYAYMKMKEVDKAENVFLEGIKFAKDDVYKAEMAINMCALLLNIKDKNKLEKWIKTAKKYIDEKSPYTQHLDYFQNECEKLQ